MKRIFQYLTAPTAPAQTRPLPLTGQQRQRKRLNRHEQTLKLQTDLQEALDQVRQLREGRQPKQTLREFLGKL